MRFGEVLGKVWRGAMRFSEVLGFPVRSGEVLR